MYCATSEAEFILLEKYEISRSRPYNNNHSIVDNHRIQSEYRRPINMQMGMPWPSTTLRGGLARQRSRMQFNWGGEVHCILRQPPCAG